MSTWTQHAHVMHDIADITICSTCSAVVIDRHQHNAWHNPSRWQRIKRWFS